MSTENQSTQVDGNVVVDPIDTQVQSSPESSAKKIIAELKQNPASRIYKNLKVRNVTVSDKDSYVQASFSLTSQINSFVDDGNGVYGEGTNNVIFTSTYAIAGLLKESEDYSFMANAIVKNPNILTSLCNGSVIEVVQVRVPAGQPYKNPFSSSDSEGNVYDHDIYVNHIVDIKLGRVGLRLAERVLDKVAESMISDIAGF